MSQTKIIYSSIKAEESRQEAIRLNRAITGKSSKAMKEMVNEEVSVKDIVVFENTYDKDGEETTQTITSIIDVNDNICATNSGVVYNSLMDIVDLLGDPKKWEVPAIIRVVSGKTNAGNTYIDVDLIG